MRAQACPVGVAASPLSLGCLGYLSDEVSAAAFLLEKRFGLPTTVSLWGPSQCWSTGLKKILPSLTGVCMSSWTPPSTHWGFTSSLSCDPLQPIQMLCKWCKADVSPYLLTASCHIRRALKVVQREIHGLCSWPRHSLFSAVPSFPISEEGASLS